MATETVDMETLKSRMKATWMAGDFGLVALSYEAGAADFVQRQGILPGTRVLDVACGSGNLALPAARAGALVTGVDIATNLLEQARIRGGQEGLDIRFDEGDVEQLPYHNGAFDVVLTMFGAMFAPRPEKTSAEMVRVCQPGGRIVMANWTPSGFIGQMFKMTGKHVPPPAGVPAPVLWGSEEVVRERLNGEISDLRLTRHQIAFKFSLTPPEVVEFFRTYYGPTQRAFEALDADGQMALRRDLEELWSEHNIAENGQTYVESEYLEVVAVRSS